MKRKAESKSYDQAALEAAMALLGVSANYTRSDLMEAYASKARHHPGGNDHPMRVPLNKAKEVLMPAHAPEQTTGSSDGTKKQDDRPPAITPLEYGGLQAAYDHFNAALFSSKLGDVFITYQRKAHSAGYFSPDRFSGRIDASGRHELALNPDGFISQTDKQICQTLVHEMVHVWQHAFGKPSARGYHNKEWAAKMKEIGLQPSSTGMVGGKETGQRMSDYIIPGGPFERSYDKLAATGWKLILQSAPRPGGTRAPNSKVKYTCQTCGFNLWGKPGADGEALHAPCGNVPMVQEIQSYDQAAE
jgi:hypothetical protein